MHRFWGRITANLSYFYGFLKYRMFIMFILSILIGVMDGFGLSMFIPLLQLVSSGASENAVSSENFVFLSNLIDSIGLPLNLTVVLLLMLSFFILKGAFRFLGEYANAIFGQFFIRSIREVGIIGLSNYRFDLFVQADAGRIQNTMSGEVGRINVAYRNYMKMCEQFIFMLTYLTLAMMTNAQFALLVALGGGITNLGFRVIYKRTKKLSTRFTESNHTFQGLLIQQVSFFKYLKATGLIGQYAKRLVDTVGEIEQNQRHMGKLNALVTGLREPVLMSVLVSVILVQVNFLGGELSLIILSILFFYRALTAVLQLQTGYNNFLNVSGSMKNMTDFNLELKEGKEAAGKLPLDSFEEEIALKNVSFGYLETDIIRDLSINIRKNETIAFVGESGSGKTTLMNLIAGLLKPDQGSLTIDGRDFSELDLLTYQKRIGYITQDPVVFDDTIFNNVTFWAPKTEENLKKFKKVLVQANIHEFVQDLPDKEDAGLGNNGINLSGGQKQRISIARELFKDIDFLFMDEATSALDSENELFIKENIELLRGKYTIIIIAHRLSTIKDSDRIVLLKKGEIDGIGDFQGLIGSSPEFKRMVELQDFV